MRSRTLGVLVLLTALDCGARGATSGFADASLSHEGDGSLPDVDAPADTQGSDSEVDADALADASGESDASCLSGDIKFMLRPAERTAKARHLS